MSSYQYYDFYAIDKPLTPEQRKEIDGYSSRSSPSARRASFTYHYGDFRYETKTVLLKHFDMALYASSYGQYQLMIKLPAELVDFRALRAYEIDGEGEFWCQVSVERHQESVIIDLNYSTEYDSWMEAEGWLDGMLPLRAQLLKGDYRLLYLAWLHIANTELPKDADWEEPPVPAGLSNLDVALDAFTSFWSINNVLIEVAATQSSPSAEAPDLTTYLAQLSDEEKDHFLALCLEEDSNAGLQLRQRLQRLAPQSSGSKTTHRSLADLRTAHKQLQAKLSQKAKEAAAEAHRKRMVEVGKQQEDMWREVVEQIEEKNASGYKQAVTLLKELNAYGKFADAETAFENRLAELVDRFSTRSALKRRLKEARLL